MPEHIGKVMEAGRKAKRSGDGTNFVMVVDTQTYFLHQPDHQKVAEHRLLQGVKVTWEPSQGDGKFRNVQNVEVEDLPAGHELPSGGGGNGRAYGKSPEERAEIAEQVAVKAAVELAGKGLLPMEDAIMGKCMAWIDKQLDHALAIATPAPAKAKPAPKTEKPPTSGLPKELADHRRLKAFNVEMNRLGLTTAEARQEWAAANGCPCTWAELTAQAQDALIVKAKNVQAPAAAAQESAEEKIFD